MGIGREDILPYRLRAVADEQKASRHAVDDLMQRVDAADCAADVAAVDFTLDLDPRVAPPEMPQRVGEAHGVGQPDSVAHDDGIAYGRAGFDLGRGDASGCAFEPPYADSERPDAFGVGFAQVFVFAAPQPQNLCGCDLVAEGGLIVFDLLRKGGLVVFEAFVFVAENPHSAGEQQRRRDGVDDKKFFHDRL